MAADARNYPIKSWSLCYYMDSARSWVYGDLSVHMNRLVFKSTSSSTADVKFEIFFSELADIKKTTTGLIFGAVVLVKTNKLKHWFSSISDREGMFNCLHYFWKAGLTADTKQLKKSPGNPNRTEMGRQLLSVAYDSDKTLRGAAENLSVQGAQIDSALGTMLDIHSDLDLADSLVSGLETWLGKWKMPKEYKYVEPLLVSQDQSPDMFEYEILYTKLQVGKITTQNLGILRVSTDGLIILTEKQKVVQLFKWSDISQVKVISLWEMVVTRFLIGQPDLSYSVISSGLIGVLKLLDKRLKSKVEYSRDVFEQVTGETSIKQKHLNPKLEKDPLHGKQDSSRSTSHMTTGNNLIGSSTQPIGLQQNLQINQPEKIVSDEEVEELSQVLGGLKSLALSVGQETDSQNEKLDVLVTSVDKANIKMNNTEKRVKNLL